MGFVGVFCDDPAFDLFRHNEVSTVIDSLLFAAAPWDLFSGNPLLLRGLIGASVLLYASLCFIGKVPLSYNFMNLVARKWTTLMTAGAFVLVIGLQTMMLAFVNGMYAMTDNTGHPGNVMIMAEGATDEAFSTLNFADATDIETQDGVLKEEGQALISRETYLNVVQTMDKPAPGRPRRRFLQVRGVDDAAMSAKVHMMKLRDGGQWFSQAGVQAINKDGETAIEVVVGYGIARELGADRQPEEVAKAKNRERLEVGETFDVGGRLWLITGIMEQSGSLYDSEIWTKQSQIGPLFGKPNYSTFVLRADPNFRKDQREAFFAEKERKVQEAFDKAVAEKAADKSAPVPVREKLVRPTSDDAWASLQLRDFFANEYKKAQLAPFVETAYFSTLTATNQQFLIGALVLCAIMSLGGIFGVMNTMFAAISQRTKDIGVLRLLGYKRWQILVSFLFESMLLALFGGLLGCAIGSLADGYTATSIVSGAMGGGKAIVLRMTVDLSTLALGMLLAVIMGFLGGLIPSLSAMRLTALEALR